MSKVNKRARQIMTGQKVSSLEVKTEQQGTIFLNRGERTFTDKAPFEDFSVEEPFAPALDHFTITFVFGACRASSFGFFTRQLQICQLVDNILCHPASVVNA